MLINDITLLYCDIKKIMKLLIAFKKYTHEDRITCNTVNQLTQPTFTCHAFNEGNSDTWP